jgi:hypothetical protein
MRAPTAIFLLSALGPLACANRGMHAPGPDGGPGAGGTVATAGRGGGGGTAGRGGSGGTGGGPVGSGGAGTGGTGTGGGCGLPADAGAATGGACGALFNFETDTQGAMIGTQSTAFTAATKSGTFTYCGSGALAIRSLFSGTTGPTIKGEILLPLPNAPIDVTGKMITVHIAADPGCSDLNLSMVLNTQSGPMYFTPMPLIRSVTNSWQTATVTVSPDGGAMNALTLSLQAFSSTNYQGTIYIDEVDVK